MSRLKRVEQLEAAVHRSRNQTYELFERTLGGLEAHAVALLDDASGPVPLFMGGQALEPMAGEGRASFETRISAALRLALGGETLPLDLTGFYRLLPKRMEAASQSWRT